MHVNSYKNRDFTIFYQMKRVMFSLVWMVASLFWKGNFSVNRILVSFLFYKWRVLRVEILFYCLTETYLLLQLSGIITIALCKYECNSLCTHCNKNSEMPPAIRNEILVYCLLPLVRKSGSATNKQSTAVYIFLYSIISNADLCCNSHHDFWKKKYVSNISSNFFLMDYKLQHKKFPKK